MTFGQRFALTIAICLAILFALALCGWFFGGWNTDAGAEPLQPPALSRYEKQFIELDRAAIDAAYQNQITHLFQTWAKDASSQPTRAVTGAKQARLMYEQATAAIDERQKRLDQQR